MVVNWLINKSDPFKMPGNVNFTAYADSLVDPGQELSGNAGMFDNAVFFSFFIYIYIYIYIYKLYNFICQTSA